MIAAIIVLSVFLAVVIVLLIGTLLHIGEMKEHMVLLGKEQHEQNKELIELMKYRKQSSEMLIQHIEILKYLVEKDPVLTKSKWEA